MTSPAAGLDPDFLGVRVDLPAVRDPAVATVDLPYTHFTVRLRPDRKLAAVAGVGIDGETLRDLGRDGIAWKLDARVAVSDQAGPAVYADNDLDRGHLVRRLAPVWGTAAEAQQANVDTFRYPNAAPQAADFNQGIELWLGLEEYLLANAATYRRRLVVLTAPVLAPDDPPYRGIQVPQMFAKVAAFLGADGLAATAYVLDQTPYLDDLDETVATADDAPPPLGPYRTYEVPVADVAALTGLDLDALAAVDVMPAPPEGVGRAAWRPLVAVDDLRW